MKRTIFTALTALALLLCLVLASCSSVATTEHEENGQSSSPSSSIGQSDRESAEQSTGGEEASRAEKTEFDFAAIMSGNGATNIVYALQDEDFKQEFVEAASKEGLQVTFGNDGTTTLKNDQNEEMVQLSDGSWKKGEKKESYWTVNEFTDLLPQPGFELISSGPLEGELITGVKVVGFSVMGIGEKAQALQYVKLVKDAGFTVNPAEVDQMTYEYIAENQAGYVVQVTHTITQIGVSIYREK